MKNAFQFSKLSPPSGIIGATKNTEIQWSWKNILGANNKKSE